MLLVDYVGSVFLVFQWFGFNIETLKSSSNSLKARQRSTNTWASVFVDGCEFSSLGVDRASA